nr:FAD-dependent oxidoreductase [Actinomycetota bacterium]
PLRVAASAAAALRREAAERQAEVTVEPAGRTYVVDPGSTLLEVAEVSGMKIEYGCRLGFCGADPVAIRAGAENLSPIEKEERITLARLGLAPNTRMACCARVHGPVTMSLEAQRGAAPTYERIEDFEYDPAVGSVVVVGSGIAGVTAADHVRRRHPDCEIHVIGRETHQLYNRMAISRLIYGRSAMQGLYLLSDPWFDEQRITSWLNTRAVAVDPDRRQVRLGTGEALRYDRLVLATGSSSFVPEVVGFGSPGTFVLREAGDAMAIRSFAQEAGCRRAVVAGGGLLGLEAAYALHKLGLKVSVLERSGTLLRRQLDDAGGRLLRRYLEGLGLEVVLEAAAAEVEGDGRPRRVRLEDGRELPCDLFLVSAGISPNVDLARDAGLEVNRGVLVDDHMRTSGPDIFAAGDVAEHRGQVYGQWPAAVEQAEVAALNAVGGDDAFSGWTPITVLKVVGVDLTSIGRLEPAADDDLVITIEEIDRDRYAKLLVSDGRIVGAILLGYPREAPAVSAAIKGELDVSDRIEALRAGDWSALRG